MKKPWMDSTIAYIPFRALIEASLMRRYHKKLLVVSLHYRDKVKHLV
jgi:hypothetical protein